MRTPAGTCLGVLPNTGETPMPQCHPSAQRPCHIETTGGTPVPQKKNPSWRDDGFEIPYGPSTQGSSREQSCFHEYQRQRSSRLLATCRQRNRNCSAADGRKRNYFFFFATAFFAGFFAAFFAFAMTITPFQFIWRQENQILSAFLSCARNCQSKKGKHRMFYRRRARKT